MLASCTENLYLPESMTPETLRAEMGAIGLTRQVDVAAALGVTQQTVSLWFSGESRIPAMVSLAVCEIKSRLTAQDAPKRLNGRSRKDRKNKG